MNLVLGMDASWGGLGWALGSDHGPLAAGHVSLSGRSWRWPALLHYLDHTIANEVADAQLLLGAGEAPVRLVIEEPPMIYTPSGPDRRGSQAAVGYGLGTLAGGLAMWWCARPGAPLGYPWFVNPSEWRKWMGIGGKGRIGRKRAAVDSARTRGWGKFLAGHAWDEKEGGAVADVAEALLLTVGAARNIAQAPTGPRQITISAPRPPKLPTTTTRKTRP